MKKILAVFMLLGLICVYAAEAVAPEAAKPEVAKSTTEAAKPAPEVSAVTPEENPFSISLTLKYANKYMSKGVVCTDGDMLFPELTLRYKGLYAGIWLAWDWNDKNKDSHVDRGNVEETDFYIGYDGISFDNIMDIDICFTYYDYPSRFGGYDDQGIYRHASDSTTCELKVDFTCTNEYVKAFKPGVAFLCNTNYHTSCALKFHTGYDVNLSFISEKLTWTNLLEAWYGDQWYRGDDYHQSGLFSAQYSTALNFALNEHVTFGPYFQLARLIKKSFSEYACQAEGNHEYNWLVGFAVNTSF